VENGIRYETVHKLQHVDLYDARASFSANRENVIIPTSGDSHTFAVNLLDKMQEVQEANPSLTLRLLGYPEWQTYASLVDEYHQIGVYFLSPFFVDAKDPAVGTFNDAFSKMVRPRTLEYLSRLRHVGGTIRPSFFLTALQRFGPDFEHRVSQVNVNSLQFCFSFRSG